MKHLGILACFFIFSLHVAAQLSVDDQLNQAHELLHSDPDSALSIFSEIILNHTDSLIQLKAYNGAGNALQFRGLYDSSLSSYLKALRMAEKLNLERESAMIRNNIGSFYMTYGDLEKAADYLSRSMETYSRLQDTVWITRVVINQAGVDFMTGQLEASLAKLLIAAQMARASGNLRSLGGCYTNISMVFGAMNQVDSALAYIDRGIGILADLGDTRAEVISLKEKASLQKANGRMADVKTTYLQMKARSEEMHYLQGLLESYKFLADLESESGNTEQAFAYLLQAYQWKDSVLTENKIAAINEMSAKYDSEKKNAEIALLTKENALQKSQRNTLLAAGSAVVVILALVIFLFAQKQKTNRELSAKNVTISEALNEREVLLQEVHHRVKNNLQVVSSLLNIQSRFLEDETAKRALLEGRNRVISMALIHEKLYQNKNLSRLEIHDYLHQLTETLFESYKVDQDEIELQMDIEPLDLSLDTAIQIGLITNELISNALKHAFPEGSEGVISLRLHHEAPDHVLTIADNGRGVSHEAELSRSHGFRIVQSLVRSLGGTLSIDLERGARFSITFPAYPNPAVS